MEVKAGDLYTRNSDGKSYRLKRIDHKMVVLELEDVTWLSLTVTSIFALEKAYSKRESQPTQESP